MTPLALAWKLAVLAEFPALATRLEREHWSGGKVWYTSQRMHWCGHLQALQDRGDRNAAACYGRIQNTPMLIWLADALNMPEDLIVLAATEAIDIEAERKPGWPQRACNAFRGHIPWEMIAKAL